MSDCACIYDGADGDLPEFYSQDWRVARKTYACIECQRPIVKGQRYECFAGKWERGMHTYRTCDPCQNIRESLYCQGWSFGQLWEDVEEQIFREGGLTVECIDKLTTPEAKRFLQQRWMEFVESRA